MKIYSISVLLAPPSGASTLLSNASDLSSFSFYQKGSVGEFMSFFSKTVAERTPQGQRQSVQENNYTAHVYNRGGAEQLAGMAPSIVPSQDLNPVSSVQLSSLQTKNIPSDLHFPFSQRFSMNSRPKSLSPLSMTHLPSHFRTSTRSSRNIRTHGKLILS